VTALLPQEHPIQWATASALWPAALAAGDPTAQRAAIGRPALLRFATDDFMTDLAARLGKTPPQLAELEAKPKSFRVRPPGMPDDWEPEGTKPTLKLYQAVHGHFNLVAASLVCQVPGLPDREVHPERGDEVGFVLRRIDGPKELAWAAGASGRTWATVPEKQALAAGEEVLPMFGTGFEEDNRSRRLFVGLIPTASNESYRNSGPAAMPAQTTPETDPRTLALMSTVVEPINMLKALPAKTRTEGNAAQAPLLVMELAAFLADNLPGWKPILEGATPTPQQPTWSLYTWFADHLADTAHNVKWIKALRDAWKDRVALCGEGGTPTFTIDLSNANVDFVAPMRVAWQTQAPTPPDTPTVPAASGRPISKLTPGDGTRYVVRCVYRRPQCGPLHDDVVGDPSAAFAIASLFDPDAPQRPVQIALPLDTSPAAFRKARKNVTIMLADQLKQQMQRVKKIKDLENGTLEDAPLDVGLVCSLSIPIITICALILLMIIVSLLNLVFWWLPFFKICLPLGLKAKG
jgi:hypothetical protein